MRKYFNTKNLNRLGLALLVGLGSTALLVRAEDKPAGQSTSAQVEVPKADADGFIPMFNGKDLSGWEGMEGFWSVKDGVISGSETKATSRQTFLIYKAIPVTSDFEMHYKYKFATPDGNSGVQFRSKVVNASDPFRIGGYQADCDGKGGYDGSIYDEAGIAGRQTTMSNRGDKTVWDADNKRHNEPLAKNNAELKKDIKIGDWNDVVLVVNGNHVTYTINGELMTDLTDNSPKAVKEGLIGLQLHKGFDMDIQFKDMKIKLLNK